GGRAFVNSNDLSSAIRAAVDDMRVTYTLGFYANQDDWDGKFHDLKVKVDRGGVEVRHRKGYVAFKSAAPSAQDIQNELQLAVNGPFESTAIAINARMDPYDKPKPGSFLCTVQVSASDVGIVRNGDHWTGALDVVYAQRAADGKVLHAVHETIDLNLPQARYE